MARNDWFQTSFNGTSGYVVAQYIAVTSGTGTCTVTTASDPLNIRKTPSTSATVIYRAAKGATLSLLDNSSVAGWFRVSSASGTGWGSSDYLTADGGSGGDYNYPIQAIVDTDKHGVGGTLNMRAYASSTAEVLTTIPDEATIYVQTLSGEWLPPSTTVLPALSWLSSSEAPMNMVFGRFHYDQLYVYGG